MVSHSFLSGKHLLFATVELHDADPGSTSDLQSSKRGFVKLLKGRPDIVKYIHYLTYEVRYYNDDDYQILPKFLRAISRSNCLQSTLQGCTGMDSSLTSAFLFFLALISSTSHISEISTGTV